MTGASAFFTDRMQSSMSKCLLETIHTQSKLQRRERREAIEMGNQKLKWTEEEEEALLAGVQKYGPGKWKIILRDPGFADSLCYRSNIDLKVEQPPVFPFMLVKSSLVD